jgi:mannobiose 2-epimerase
MTDKPMWRSAGLCFVLMPLLAAHAEAQVDRAELAEKYMPKLERILTENIAPFWYDKCLDREHGGYSINFDQAGEPKGPGVKMIVTQARTVWLFSRLARAGYRRDEYLAAADLGYRFLTEKMWDGEHGGFYWEVDVTGNQKRKPRKHLYGQSFGLYALSEYYLASGNREVLDFAVRFFNLLEAKAHDDVHGGYVEAFEPDWTETPASESTYMGTPAHLKLMNTHLHLMEAMTTFYRASRHPLARERLLELINIQSNAVVRKNVGACTDKYERNWTPRLDGRNAQVSYGHDIENVWLLMDACDAAGISNHPFGDLYETLFAYSLKYGYDSISGAVFYTGSFNQPATDRSISWWVQAEALVSALRMYRFTNDPKYRAVFEKAFEYIETNLVDWQAGEWHHMITPEGKVRGDKASPWKAGYHNGRAMIECLEILAPWRR